MRKQWFKLTSVLLALAVLFAGCSSSAPSETQSSGGNEGASSSNAGRGSSSGVIDLDFWVPFSGSDGEFMQDMVTAFNQSQDEIRVQFMNNNWDNYYPKLNTSLVSGAAPDVAVAHTSQLANLIPTGKIEPLGELASEAGLDWSEFGDNQINAVMSDGEYYAVPLDTHALIMYYNKTYLDEAGLLNADGSIKMGEGAEGFTEMLRTLKQTLPSDVVPLSIGSNNILTYWIWYALVHQQGGTYIADGQPTIHTPESVTAMELIRLWIDEGLTQSDVGDQHYDIFKTQKAAITFTGVWATGNFESDPDLDFAAVPFPQLYDKPVTWGDSHTIIVPVQDDREKQVAAVKFADWLTDNGAMWAKAGHVPVKPAVFETEEFQSMPYRADYAGVMANVQYMPSTPKLGGLNDITLEYLVEINYGADIEESLRKAQEDAEAFMNQ